MKCKNEMYKNADYNERRIYINAIDLYFIFDQKDQQERLIIFNNFLLFLRFTFAHLSLYLCHAMRHCVYRLHILFHIITTRLYILLNNIIY